MYKLSNYNYFIPDEDNVIYLNGITTKIFAVKQIEHAKIQKHSITCRYKRLILHYHPTPHRFA